MKLIAPSLSILLLGAPLSARAEVVLIPNGDFETADGASWIAGPSETDGEGPGGASVFGFPDTGGNPGGFGQINIETGNYAVFVAEDVTLESLGLIAGEAYDFKMDMINLDGPGNVGGLKVEFPDVGGNSGDVLVDGLIGDGSTWETYSFRIPIPEGATMIRFVPLWGGIPSNVGFDNVGVDNTPVVVEPPPAGPFLITNGDFSTGKGAWGEASDGPTGFSYPGTGGNPGGHAVMDFTTGNYAVLVSQAVLLETLGLTPGQTYVFSMDMINLDGPGAIGGLKLEFPGASPDNSGDMRMPVIGDGSTWETYEFLYTVPADATTIRFVPLWGGADTRIGYDNVGGNNIAVAPPPPTIPNFDFETPGGSSWEFATDEAGSDATVSYPADGGNPGGHAVIDRESGTSTFAQIESNSNMPMSLESLGLTAGETYTLLMDMKIVSGSNIGGLNVEFIPTGTGPVFPELIGDGSTWETYSFTFTIPTESGGLFIYPLGGDDSIVAFDNVRFELPDPPRFEAKIVQGDVVGWTPTSATNTYQPQKSDDNLTWTDLGPAILGDSVASAFDGEGSPFHRVEEYSVTESELVVDGGFEVGVIEWMYFGVPSEDYKPVEVQDADLAHSGEWFVRLAVDNEGVADPRTSVLQQSTAPGSVAEGDSLDFSFWAFVEANTGANQFYSVKWRNSVGAVISQVDGQVNTPMGSWAEVSVPGLVAPAGADSAFIEFGCVTGAVEDHAGSYRLDDVSLSDREVVFVQTLPASTAPGVEISWQTETGSIYQAECSDGLLEFADFGPAIDGDGSVKSVLDLITPESKFFRVVKTP